MEIIGINGKTIGEEKKCEPVAGFVNNLLRRQWYTFCNVNISRISASVSIVELYVIYLHKCNTLYKRLQLRNNLVIRLFFAGNQQPFKGVFTTADCILQGFFLYRSLTFTGSLEPPNVLMLVLANRRNLMLFI